MKKLMIVAAIFALSAACSSVGQKFSMADVDTFQPGVTTSNEVIAKFGKPRVQQFNEDGSKSLTWAYAQGGLLAGHEARGVKLQFDKDDKFVRVMGKTER